MRYACFFMVSCFLFFKGSAQDNQLVGRLLGNIAAKQVTQDSFYYAGMFPSYRYYGYTPGKAVDDNNIFFTGLIVFTLQQLAPSLTGEDSILCEKIIRNAQKSYSYFQYNSERPTYNFWKKHPQIVFPNSWFLDLFKKKNALPDDLDDTVILLLGLEANDSTARRAKLLMEATANTVTHQVHNTFRKYRNIPAYSTWFGEKMPIDFDFCVLCNVLYFVKNYDLPFSSHDSASVTLLENFLRNKEYMSHPAYISPHYARTPVLLYHIARLLGRFPIPSLVRYKPQLIDEAERLLSKSENIMDKIILSTALTWLGHPPEKIDIQAHYLNKIMHNDFVFFIAGFYSLMPNPFKRIFSNTPLIKYYYRCPAYNEALLLQYLILRDAIAKE